MSLDYIKSTYLFYVGIFVGLFVIVQSLFFIKRAFNRGKELNMGNDIMKKAVYQSAIFSIVPSLAILITIVTLSKALGLYLPWIRLSVIGAITYEVPAATNAAAVYGYSIGETINDPVAFANIAWVMTVGSFAAMLLIIFFFKKFQGSLDNFKENRKKASTHYTNALFLGMISSFIGYGICGSEANGVVYGSIISVLTMLVSAVVMIFCGWLIKKQNIKWLENFAIPFSMIIAMCMSIVFYNVLPESLSTWTIPGLF